MKKTLKRLSSKELFGDVKQFIRGGHDFYRDRNPEIKVLAGKLHDEYKLEEFYKVFNRLWKSGYHNERVLAVYALNMYEEDYDKETWRFLIPRLREIRDFDEAERIGRIIGLIMIKCPGLKREIMKINSSRNVYYRRISLASCFSLIRVKEWDFILKLVGNRINDKEENIQEINGWILREISKTNKTVVRRFVLKNINMPEITFDIIGNEIRDLKKVRKLKKLNERKVVGISWLKMIG